MSADAQVRQRFLAILFEPGSFINLRSIGYTYPCSTLIPTRDFRGVEAFIKAHSHTDLFFGVAARLNPENGGGLRNCGSIRALFADVDIKTISEADAWDRIEQFEPKANIVIHSGGGLNCYWLLREPVDLQKNADLFKRYLRGLARLSSPI